MISKTETAPDVAPLEAAFLAALPGRPPLPPPGADAFLRAIAADYRPDELPGVSAADIAVRAAGFWTFAQASSGDRPDIRIGAATGADGRELGADLVEIVQPDAPFLVDSVMAELVAAGAGILAMFHPVLETAAGRRSTIQVWIEPMGEEAWPHLAEGLRTTLADVRLAVGDFEGMTALMERSIAELKAAAPRGGTGSDPASLEEDLAFLAWLDAGQFVFLGARSYDYPREPDGEYAAEEPQVVAGSGLGLLRDPNRFVLRRANEPAVLSPQMRRELSNAHPLHVGKSNLKSVVHRRVYMDYVGVRRFGPDGRPSGETRFVGLFTAQAYDEPVRNVPLVRRKLDRVMARAGQAVGSHNAMRLANILETYPRDELFQASEDELLEIALGVLHLSDRPRVKLFVRLDPFDRFVSILFYAPRERYDARLREEVGQLLAEAFGGHVSAYYPNYSDAPLARVHYIVGVTPLQHLDPDLASLERTIALLARTWSDDFETVVRRRAAADQAAAILAVWAEAFPPGYRDRYGAAEGLADLAAASRLGPDAPIAIRAFRQATDSPRSFRFKLYNEGEPLALADVLPILDNMGLKALSEEGFALSPAAASGERRRVWVHEFALDDPRGAKLSFEAVRQVFEDAFLAIWAGQAESDGFNRLVLELSLPWRLAALIRALARYRLQSGLDPSPAVQQQALSDHPEVAGLILELFRLRLDPTLDLGAEARAGEVKATLAAIEEALQAVDSLDADRALRRLAALTAAIQRTNFYQPGADGQPKPYISFKVASRELADLPDPKPYREIFVASPAVEGVHLRLGPVARGGLRWSDRRDDFRTEVLGLVKAQQVKNAVIVPVGSKGGFFPKRLPKGGSAADVRAEAIVAYKIFLDGLLDITDTIDAEGEVVHPAHVIAHDGEDPYLVVAADKGTATFSDIANGVAESYGFWLGDAFASGGSAGYDHKAMGITARGAWEGIKRHFRELGKDIQAEPFTCVGVGDMSGDVFGNGLLLSMQTRLVAAFDHRHIFLDPDPDVGRSWVERHRLFELATSSWDNYDRDLISPGGGVFPRTLKSIALTAEVKALLDLKVDALTPAELITAILKARVELLYLGGIGTYVKGAGQSHLDVGDKANDLVRVNGRDLRCRVVGEGANLGFTQAGRIEYALDGGRIDTDAIDNSAGVDTSDHEVNIKILAGMAERSGRLKRENRDALLASMTDEIAVHVLSHNYDQTLALSMMQAEAVDDLAAHGAFMVDLEKRGKLDRGLEGLPSAAELAERAKAGKGLTRPELAVLLAYGKLDLSESVIASQAPDDPHFLKTLRGYFPTALAPFEDEMKRHRLRREIIATVIGNELINLCGPTFPGRLMAAAGCGVRELAVSFEAAREVLDFAAIWSKVTALDGKAPAAAQTALFRELAYVLRGQTYWLARRAGKDNQGVDALIGAYRRPADALKPLFPQVLSPFEQKAAVRRAAGWIKAGAPRELAHQVALYRPLSIAAVLADLAREQNWPVAAAARLYHQIGGTFAFDRLRAAAGARTAEDAYERLAVRRLIEDLLDEQASLTRAVMAYAGRPEAGEDAAAARSAVNAWSSLNGEPVRAARSTIADIEKDSGGWSFAKLTIANAALRALT
ncbi:MAG TPA: NAD-glutamate dehydrogenase [Caulobacteraceae bacterium]|nr:NAD-glutamate dehydrogenase [Caulobacteraceae bacterium]